MNVHNESTPRILDISGVTHGDIAGEKLTRSVQQIGTNALYLFTRPEHTIDPVVNHIKLTENPALGVGRENSMMRVWFADIEAYHNDNTVFSQPVAIKPIGPAWLATQETRMNVLVNNIGADDHPDVSCCPVTFVPRGILVTDDGKFNTVTTYEKAVRSFDNDLQNEERPSEVVINNALGFAAASLVYLHANKITHGDFQVKNTASDGVSGRIIDLTTAKQRHTINDSNIQSFYHDFEEYLLSVHKARELNKISKETLLEHFVEPILDCLPDLYPTEFLHDYAANAYTLVDDLFK